jgi:hypothetical protein
MLQPASVGSSRFLLDQLPPWSAAGLDGPWQPGPLAHDVTGPNPGWWRQPGKEARHGLAIRRGRKPIHGDAPRPHRAPPRPTWALVVEPSATGTTRLLSRHREQPPHGIVLRLWTALMALGAFVMERKLLLGIKHRAERNHPAFAPSIPSR